ncbi:MAG: trypsin-like peptidase domain-containing protein, partial [Halobacteria archaeon]|nr:trypsin-like peptidase domain-containing protein [Halobacteria archaeon]
NGHIVTNQHVVGETDQVELRFSNGEWRTADVIGTDIYTDLAVLEVDRMPDYTEALPVASSDPRIGQRVVALGNPLGLEGSMTHGIVSGLNRSMTTRTNFAIPDTIQTDAAVNPGNSGGPLVSMNGVVVGVNRAKQGDNIGFAISPALIREVVPSLIKTGNVEHPYMGISSVTVTPTVAEVNGIGEPRGVLVVEVLEDGPSQGVLEPSPSSETVNGRDVPKGGDVILSIEGTRISSNEELAGYLMTRTEPGETVSIRVLRDGEERTVELTLGTRPEP